MPVFRVTRHRADKFYRHFLGVSIQHKAKRIQAYCFANIINNILSTCQNSYVYRNYVIIDSEIASKIKTVLADNITKKIEKIIRKAKQM